MHEFYWMLRIAKHIPTLQVVDIEVTWQAQTHLNDSSAYCILYTFVLTGQAFDADHNVLGHEEQILLLNYDSSFNFSCNTVTDQRT